MVFLSGPAFWTILASVAAFVAGRALGAEVAGVVGLAVALAGREVRDRSRWLSRELCRWRDEVWLAATMLIPPSAYLAGVFADQGTVTCHVLARLWAAPLVAWGLSRLEVRSAAQWGGLLFGCWVLPALLDGVAA